MESRKLAAILFTDIVGYTSLVGSDEAKGAEVREKHSRLVQTLVAQYRGQWVEEAGDETLSVFASSLDAVHCALAIQAALADDPELNVRIGIHIGDVLERDGRLIGDAVNIAARIRPLAEPGGVCVSVRVYEDVRSHPEIQATLVGERRFKNVDQPVQVYTVTRVPPVGATRAPRPRRGRSIVAVAVLFGLLAGGYVFYQPLRDTIFVALLRWGMLQPRELAPWTENISFTTTSDGVRIAYASAGKGSPVILVLGWFTHLEYPMVGWAESLAKDHRVIIYDGRGTGLSDKSVGDYSLEAKLRDLDAVVSATGLERFALYGISAGGPTSIAYAARHPERVSRLAFFGAFAGFFSLPKQLAQFKALVPVVRNGWGQDNPAYRQLFTSFFMPEGSELEMRMFNEYQRIATTPDDAAEFIHSMTETDTRALAMEVRSPTLVLHLRGDAVVPFELGREIASLIPGARLVTLEGNNHAMLQGDPAIAELQRALSEFFAEDLSLQ